MHSLLLKSRFWWKKEFCWKNCNFNFFGVREFFSYFWQQRYGRLAKISLCMFRRTVWRINFLESLSFFLQFPMSIKSFQKFDEKFLAGLSQPHSAFPDEDVFHFLKERKEGKFSFRKSCIAIFFELWTKKILSALASMVTAGLSKIRCTCSDEHFYKYFFGKLIIFSSFPEFQRKVFRVLTRMFWQDGHNYILHVQKHNLSKNNFLSKNSYIFSSLFGIWTANLWVFKKKLFGVVDQIAFSVAKETFLKKEYFLQEIVFSTILGFGKAFCILGNKVTARLPKFQCACSDEHFEEK